MPRKLIIRRIHRAWQGREAEMTCEWGQYCFNDVDFSIWNTSCGNAFIINEGSPSANEMKFCCYCGKLLVEHPYVDEDDE